MDNVVTGAMLVAIGNGRSYGGGMLVCPEANMQDGKLDVLILKPVPIREFLRVFPRVFKGTHISHPAVEIRQVTEFTLHADAIAYADGERIGQLPLKVQVVPQAMLTWI
jgi:diacylglycerol kinase (ATP)